jgi:hypothetical protein
MKSRLFTVVATALAAIVIATAAVAGQASKVDVTGKWIFNVETSAGSGTPTITLKQDGDKLTGHYSGQLGEADLTGTVKGQDVSFKFTVDVQGNNLDCTYSGTAEAKDAMKGKVNIAGLGDGTFTAKKQ